MASKAPRTDIDETKLSVGSPKKKAVGIPAVLHALQISMEQMGPIRSAQTLLRVNQKDGFDCPGCAWPDPEHRHLAEFCENGAKAVAEEATVRKIGPTFFAEHSIDELRTHDDWWLGQQGRLTHPMILDEGATHYREISWDDALDVIAEELRTLDDPNESIFYTSGRASNESAFLYQLLVRGIGTNNLPDCSNMCHESSGSALTETIGIGKGTVSLEDIYEAKLVIVAGQNPGTNHPRMLSALEKAKANGGIVVAVNPLPEAGLLRFKNPQNAKGVILGGTPIADHFLQIRAGGDQALFQAIGKYLLEVDARDGGVIDRAFIETYTSGFDAYVAEMAAAQWSDFVTATGIEEAELRRIAELVRQSPSTIVCWAMGLTQHKHSVPTLRDVVNVLLLQGNIGRPGAGVCPVRGHSNVQGDRTVGIYEKPSDAFLDAIDAEFDFASPRAHGYDTVEAIRAMDAGKARFFMGLGGNFVSATPDTPVVERAMAKLALTVQLSTKLNRSHVITGRRGIILPVLGRTDRDRRGGRDQRVSVEDSMGAVHASRGRLAPPSDDLLSEVAIIARLCDRVFGTAVDALPDDVAAHSGDVDRDQVERTADEEAAGAAQTDVAPRRNVPRAHWRALETDYGLIRSHIANVIPGFEDYNARIDKGRTFFLPNGPHDDRRFATSDGKAQFTANPLEYPHIPEGRLLLQTLRSHDQYNTTIYGKDDRYRGIHDGRRVVLVNADDIVALGFEDAEIVDLVSEWRRADGSIEERRADAFRIVAYSTPRGNAAAYYPETNVLVPLDSTADISGTPTSKAVIVRLEHRSA